MPIGVHNVSTTTLVELPLGKLFLGGDRRRFWSKVAKGAEDVCWLWTASCHRNGYGQFVVTTPGGTRRRYVNVLAHRAAWILAQGRPIPESLHVLHSCDVPHCVNPDHLFLGSHTDNMRDASEKGRLNVPRRRTRDFKAEVIDRYLAGGITAQALAVAYGVHKMTVHRWVKAATHDADQRALRHQRSAA